MKKKKRQTDNVLNGKKNKQNELQINSDRKKK